MGLDVYFYRKPLYKTVTKSAFDVLSSINYTDNEKLVASLRQLNEYCLANWLEFEDTLANAVNAYILNHAENGKYSSSDENGENVAYFRKFWWLLERFNYSDENYGKDMQISKEDLEDIVEYARKIILTVEKHFNDNGWVIEKSPTLNKCNVYYYDFSLDNYFSFKNGIVTEKLMDEADDICSEILDSNDSFLFRKVCYMYMQFSYILESTDWDKEALYMCADW